MLKTQHKVVERLEKAKLAGHNLTNIEDGFCIACDKVHLLETIYNPVAWHVVITCVRANKNWVLSVDKKIKK